MSERTRNLIYTVAMVVMAGVLGLLLLTYSPEQDRLEAIANRIMCPVCQGESIANSPAEIASDMKDLIAQRIAEGATDQEIIDELLSSYSGALLLDPPTSGNTLPLWLAPLGALAVGSVVILWWKRHPGSGSPASDEPRERSKLRIAVGALILVGSFAGTILLAVSFFRNPENPNAGLAAVGEQDLASISNDTMEAVIAANLDNPQINGMRLALAERYFEAGDYRAAFPHYFAVASSPEATDAEVTAALVQLGWMAWDGNRELETAVGLLDQALAIDPDLPAAKYLKALVLWCGNGDVQTAASLLQEVLATTQLDEDLKTPVRQNLDAVTRGESCA
ncbi:MAG: cytochrome c-type biogenesis protein CcmH [Acidimicrobiia bacterium]